jgi:hypothetical protein
MAVGTRSAPFDVIRAMALDCAVLIGLAILCFMDGRTFGQATRRLVACLRVGAYCAVGIVLLGASRERSLAIGAGATLLAIFSGLPPIMRRVTKALLVGAVGCWVLGLSLLR